MAPFSDDSELQQYYNAFYQGRLDEVLNADLSSVSDDGSDLLRQLQLRCKLVQGQSKEVLRKLDSLDNPSPELQAIRMLAHLDAGETAKAEQIRTSLIEQASTSSALALLIGMSFQLQDQGEAALGILEPHHQDIEIVALRVYIHLARNRTDLASNEVSSAKPWANDSLLFNLAESWVGMRTGGPKYQQAYYVFEELAGNIATMSQTNLECQAVSELHMARLPEAETALDQVLAMDPESRSANVNKGVLNVLQAKGFEASWEHLSTLSTPNPMSAKLQEMSDLFDTAASKYSAKVPG